MTAADATKKRGLGRGLDALFSSGENAYYQRSSDTGVVLETKAAVPMAETAAVITSGGLKTLPIGQLVPGKFQPRTHFDDAEIENLAASIKTHGILQPLLVRPLTSNTYEIIAGERRWRAAQKAKLHQVPVRIENFSDSETLEIALVENLQRQDLSAIEEAEGYQRLIDEFEHTQDVLAQHLGKSRSHIANTLRLLKLPDSVKEMIADGKLSAGHARALITAKDPVALAREVVSKGLSVRETERLAARAEGFDDGKKRAGKNIGKVKGLVTKDVDTLACEEKLSSKLGLRVTIDVQGQGPAGRLVIDYKTLDQLDAVIKKLML